MVSMDSGVPLGSAIEGNEISLASQASGDVMYYNGTAWVRLAKGTASQVLKMNSGATAPEWGTDLKGLTLVDTQTASTSQTLTFSSLDINTDGIYYLVGRCENGSGGASNLYVYFNGDTTDTNYYYQNLTANNATISGARGNSTRLGQDIPDGDDLVFTAWVVRDNNGYVRLIAQTSFTDPSGIVIEQRTITASTTLANLTSIAFKMSNGNYTDGSNIKLYKLGG